MKKAIDWMIDNHVTVNLVMLLIIFSGIFASTKINQEIFPEIKVDVITIQVVYRGATPEDIENSVVTKIEEAISNLDGIDRMTSNSAEGVGVVNVELKLGEDVNELKDKIETEVNRINTFPVNAEKPVITIAERNRSVIQIALSGNFNYDEMNKLSQRVKDDLISLDGISQIAISGTKNYEIDIGISEKKLHEYGISFSEITNAIKMENFDMPAGKIKRKNDEILLRTKGLRYNADDYKNIVIRTNFKGAILTLGDIANIKDGYEDSDLYSYFNNKPTVMLNIYRTGNQSALKIAKLVHTYVKKIKPQLPKGIQIKTWDDQSKLLKGRLDLMLRNAAFGFILVLIVLTLFLDLRLALWVSSGIIISFVGVFVIMYLLGVTINIISLFAFILVLGIVVDDAIVIGEEIYSNRENGMPPKKASKIGAKRIAVPVVFSVLTTVATFSPLLFVSGRMGDVMGVIPVIVIGILSISLFEALFILPAHLSTINLKSETYITKASFWLTRRAARALQYFINKVLEPSLRIVLKYRMISMAVFFALLIASLGLIAGGFVKFEFFPEVESDNAIAKLQMPQGTSLYATKKIINKIEDAVEKTKNDLEKKYPKQKNSFVKNIFVSIGEQPSTKKKHGGTSTSSIADPSKAEVNIELIPSENRPFTTKEFIKIWKRHVGKFAGIENLEFQSILMSAGDAVSIEVKGDDFKTLNKAVDEIKKKLSSYSGVYNVKDSFLEGKYEIKFKLTKRGELLGVRLIDIASKVKNSFFGNEVMRIQRGKYEVKLRVQYPEKYRSSINDIKKMRIRTKSGLEIPLSEVATFKLGRGYATISHSDQKRNIIITASVDVTQGNASDINKNLKDYLLKTIKKKYYGLSFNFEGAQKERKKSMGSLIYGFIIAIFLVYMLLAIPFKSYIQPFIIMLSIPYGIIGAIWAHYFLGFNFSFLSAIGVVALSGVVVNDALVLIDYINELFNSEEDLTKDKKFNFVIIAVKKRFRPILLTSITTFLGLVPIIFEKSLQAQFLIPMAISLGFGIMFATIITLYLIPSGVLITEDIKGFFKGAKHE